jgi:hypothetical protein
MQEERVRHVSSGGVDLIEEHVVIDGRKIIEAEGLFEELAQE